MEGASGIAWFSLDRDWSLQLRAPFHREEDFTPSPHLLPGLKHLPEFGTLGPGFCEERDVL